MRIRLFAVVAVGSLALLAAPSRSDEAAPPNRSDPCAGAGKNTCGTLGVGYYKTYRYGMRWFGDFRGAVPGESHLFCLDFRFWYPSPSYRYREDTSGALTNRDGGVVPVERQQRLAYAIWRFGRSADPDRQAAVMLYVHELVGDGRAGEVDPGAIGVASLYSRIDRESALYHGPYRVDIRLPDGLLAGRQATATIRVLSAAGNPLPDTEVTVSSDGGAGRRVRTSSAGVATVAFTPASAGVRLTARAVGLASTMPRIFEPTTPAAGPNGQRLALPAAQEVTGAAAATVAKRQVAVTTAASPSVLAAGAAVTDRVTISGAAPGWRGTVAVRLHGPFPTLAQVRCDGTPAWKGSLVATGNGTYTTPSVKLTQAGWYSYVEVVPGDAATTGLTTPCGVAAESVKVQAAPRLATVISAQRVGTGASVFDTVHVEGLAGVPVSVHAALYGPFASRDRIACDGTPLWSGALDVRADGDYQTTPVVVTLPGYYTYRERIDGGDLVRAVQSACAEQAETVLATARPEVETRVSSGRVQTGATVGDRITVGGLGALAVQVRVELWGPFTARGAIRCSGTAYRVQLISASAGDGSYETAPVPLSKPGYYTYRASILAGPLNDAFTAPCGEDAETVLAVDPPPPPKPPTTTTTTTTPKPPPPTTTTTTTTPAPPKTPAPRPSPKPRFRPPPSLTTVVSSEVVRPGSSIFDTVRARGIRGRVEVQLFGPFPTRAAMRCSGTPRWTGRVTVRRDGLLRSPPVRVAKAGFYVFRERVLGPNGAVSLTTACAIAAETSLAAPRIAAGRGEHNAFVRAGRAGAATPTRVRIGSLGIDAPVVPVGIDLGSGALGLSGSIHRAGWWRDGAAPGAATGTILIAGHVDSALAGPGAFFKLHLARAGDRVALRTAGGRVYTYRVVSVRSYPKRSLPTGIWSRRGRGRLVLVTCGGPFDPALRHYRDNVVLVAVRA